MNKFLGFGAESILYYRLKKAIINNIQKILHMKKFAFITGAVSISLIGIGMIFEMNHWHPAALIVVIGLGVFSLLFTPSIFKYLYDREASLNH
jgi:hypothetical protein